MAKYDPARIDDTAEPYAPGTSGIEPLCDEQGRMVLAPGSGGGGGDATAANQVLGLTALDSIYDALQLVGTEATSADILAAVNSLGDGATLADLAAALAPLATEATQADILAALEAQAIDVGLIQTNVALLVPDVDAMKDSLASIDGKLPTSLGAKTSANSLSIVLPSDFAGLGLAAGTNWVGKFIIGDGTNAVAVLNSAPAGSEYGLGTRAIGNTATTNAVSSQADGHSASIGATTDANTANTVIGRLQKLVSLLPTVLGTGGGLKIDGSGTALPVDTELPPAVSWSDVMSNPTAPAVIACLTAVTPGGSLNRMSGVNGLGLFVQGSANSGSNFGGRPVVVGGVDVSSNARSLLTDTSGRPTIVGAGASTPATSVSSVQATNTRTANGAPAELTAATSLTTTATKLLMLELRYTHAGTKFVWIFDKANATVTAADAACIPIPIANNDGKVVVDLSTVPLNLANGCVISLSSTETTYTADATGFYARGTWQ